MYRIWQSNGTVVERGHAGESIVMRVVYQDPAAVFLGYQLLKKLGAREAFRVLGVPVVKLDDDPDRLTDEEFLPGTLFFYGPSPGRPAVANTLEGARRAQEATRGKWFWRFRSLQADRGSTGMSDSEDKVFEESIAAVAQHAWVSG